MRQEVNGYKDKDKQKYIVIMKRDQRVQRQSHKKRKDIHIMRRGGRSTGTLRITAYLDQLSFAPMDHVAATPRHNHHHHLHHHCMHALYGGSETTVSFVESPFFGVIKFKLNITTWLVHFGRAWKRLNINGLHFIICQVILRGVWCREWEGFAKFFLWMSRAAECVFLAQNEAGGLLQSDEIQSEIVYIS